MFKVKKKKEIVCFISQHLSSLSQVAVEIPNVKRVKMRRDSQYPTKRDHMICKCLSLSITYAATIGGLITITGTSTNLIFAEQFNTYVNVRVLKKPCVEQAELVLAGRSGGGGGGALFANLNAFTRLIGLLGRRAVQTGFTFAVSEAQRGPRSQ